jgi:hypothetical protein
MTWRDVMSQTRQGKKELDAFDADLYDNRGKRSYGSNRISGDTRTVAFGSKDVTSRANSTPEQNARAAEVDHSLRVITMIPQACASCGGSLPREGEKKYMILADEGDGSLPILFPCCQSCFNALGIKLETKDWFSRLPPLDQKVWRLRKAGLTQREIAARLTNGAQRVTQQSVSVTLLRIIRQIKSIPTKQIRLANPET